MAALVESVLHARAPDLVDLRHLSPSDLDTLLDEETRVWRETLDWDFGKSADLVRRFVDLRALNGCALIIQDRAVGYCYFVFEEHKGLVGDLYVRAQFRTVEHENRLLSAVLDSLIAAPHVRRIESQLMMIASDPERVMPGSRFLSAYDRNFMLLRFAEAPDLQARPRARMHFEKWSEHHQENTAQLIASAYGGHIDSRINDQYRSIAGARRFLYNIVQYPGCGTFFQPASFVAYDLATGSLCGLALASMVGPDAGHITQLCVSPALRRTGMGYELLRRSLKIIRDHGCSKVSLTVTSANREAVQLYEHAGFRTIRRFSAYVWEGF